MARKCKKKNPTQNANSYLINIQFIDESKSVHKLRNTQHTLTWNTFPHSLHLCIQYIHNTHSHRDELDSSCQRTKHMECQRTLCTANELEFQIPLLNVIRLLCVCVHVPPLAHCRFVIVSVCVSPCVFGERKTELETPEQHTRLAKYLYYCRLAGFPSQHPCATHSSTSIQIYHKTISTVDTPHCDRIERGSSLQSFVHKSTGNRCVCGLCVCQCQFCCRKTSLRSLREQTTSEILCDNPTKYFVIILFEFRFANEMEMTTTPDIFVWVLAGSTTENLMCVAVLLLLLLSLWLLHRQPTINTAPQKKTIKIVCCGELNK